MNRFASSLLPALAVVAVLLPQGVVATLPCGVNWILGYSSESCTQTCGRTAVAGSCDAASLSSIVTQNAFYSMLGSAMSLQVGNPSVLTATGSGYCNLGVNDYDFTTILSASDYMNHQTAAAFTFRLTEKIGGDDIRDTYCNYPSSLANLGGDCDTTYSNPPAQRFCPCITTTCTGAPTVTPSRAPSQSPTKTPTKVPTAKPTRNPTVIATDSITSQLPDCMNWVLGYSGDSCDQTCAYVARTCDPNHLSDIQSLSDFETMLSGAWELGTTQRPGLAPQFCQLNYPVGQDDDVNWITTPIAISKPPATVVYYDSPAVACQQTISSQGTSNTCQCDFPTTRPVTDTCSTKPANYAAVFPLPQRFCPCHATAISTGVCPTLAPTAAPNSR